VDEAAQAVAIRRRRDRAEIEKLVAEFEAGGLTRTAFCLERGLSLSTLARYRRRPPQQASGEAGGAKRWLAVEVVGPTVGGGGSGLAVLLAGGRRIEIGRGLDAGTLRQLVLALEQI
jgi:hypothetical protein